MDRNKVLILISKILEDSVTPKTFSNTFSKVLAKMTMNYFNFSLEDKEKELEVKKSLEVVCSEEWDLEEWDSEEWD
jgi:hypothetical protein